MVVFLVDGFLILLLAIVLAFPVFVIVCRLIDSLPKSVDYALRDMGVSGWGLLTGVDFFVSSALYYSLMEGGKRSATFGKSLSRYQVANLNGEPITRRRALGRFLAKCCIVLSVFWLGTIVSDANPGGTHHTTDLTMLIGYYVVMAALFVWQPYTNKLHQTLYDRISGTVVHDVYSEYKDANPFPARQ